MSDLTGERSERQPLGAAALAVLLPGLGHVYARAGARALLWATLFLASLWFLGPDGLSATVSTGTLDPVSDSPGLLLFTVAVWAVNIVDAYLTASRLNQRATQGRRCPDCGKELDADLEFCHWCTTSLDAPDAETEEP